MTMPVAVQLYTLREETSKDFIGTLKKVADIGYKGVEFAGFADIKAEDMRKALDELGLKAVGSHTGIELLRDNFEAVVEYNLKIGNKYIIVPWAAAEGKEGYEKLARELGEIGQKLKQRGLQLCYHNHDHEFQIFDGVYGMDILLDNNKPENLMAEIDTCWVFYAGLDPAGYVRKNKGRCPLVHVKDLKSREEKVFAEVGSGVIDVASVVAAAKDIGAEWIVVEQDECRIPCLESVKISFDNLKKMGLI